MRGSLTGNFVRKTGDTMTGALTINGNLDPAFVIIRPDGANYDAIDVRQVAGGRYIFRVNSVQPVLRIADGGGAERDTYDMTNGKMLAGIVPLARQPHAQGDPGELLFFEDFLGGLLTAGNIGEKGWGLSVSGTGALLQSISEANHNGTRQLSTGATINSFVSIFPNNGTLNILLGSDVFDLMWIFRQVSSDANIGLNLGMQDASNSMNPPNGMYLQKLAADVNYFFVCRNGGVQTRVDSGVAADANWHSIRIKDNGAGNVQFSLDKAALVNIGTNRTNQLVSPMAVLTNTIAATRDLIVDACALYMPLIR